MWGIFLKTFPICYPYGSSIPYGRFNSAYLNMCKMVCMTYIDNTTFKNFRYTLHITTNIFVTCRFTSMTHGPTIEPRGMFSTALAKHKTALGKHKIFKNNYFEIHTCKQYWSNVVFFKLGTPNPFWVQGFKQEKMRDATIPVFL